MMSAKDECSILVTGCYAYRDVLYCFEHFFEKFWSDCPFSLILNIDKEIPNLHLSYDKIVVSNHEANLIRMRDVIFDTPYVIMMQDDHFLFDKVSNDEIFWALERCKKYDCGNFRLLQDPHTAVVFPEEDGIMEYNKGAAYRISARGGLWKADYLKMFIDEFDDFWGMERGGQALSEKYDNKILCSKKRVLPIIDAVHKGFYEDFANMMLEANGIETQRSVMPGKVKVKEDLKAAIIEVNPGLVTGVLNRLNIGYKKKYNNK